MFKKRLNSKMLMALGALLLAVCASAFAVARTGVWEVNPAAFRYDMSLYFKLADKDYEDLDTYEIGAFVGDECRGIAERLDLPDGGSCLHMRIRSNEADGESVDFLLRQKESGDTVILKPLDGAPFLFKSDSRVGLPSSPLMMTRFYSVSVKTVGKGSVVFTDSLYAVGSVIDLNALPAEGYHFEGWSDGLAEDARSFTVNGNESLTAIFSPNMYKLVFKLDGEELLSEEVACDASIVAPEVPAKVGYSFSGWGDVPPVMPASDLVVSGSYTINSYRLSFKIDGTDVYSAEVPYDSPIAAPAAPAKEGYTFNGWGEVPATMPAHDVEMHSSYAVNSYKLTFELDGETILAEEIPYGSSIVAPEAPAREGHTFTGWGEVPATMPASELSFKGGYEVNSYKLVFKIDGEDLLAEEVDYGSILKAPDAPVKKGYSFNGWGELPETMPAHDIEMHSSYTINYYTLTFKLDDEVILSEQLTYGTSIVAPEVAQKIGYIFPGWGDVPAEMPDSDLEFSGKYELAVFNVTYKVDGEVAYHAEVKYGSEVPVFNPEAKEGYSFSGWGLDIPAVMPAKDLEYNGNFIVNMYAITFRIGGSVISSDRVAFGTQIVAPEAPAKEGHSFAGWKSVPATMPAKDVVVDGDYAINRYKVTYLIKENEFLTQEYDFGAPIKAPEPPVEEGHSFSGWGDIPATMPAFDLVFGGTYAENFYRVTFRLDGVVLFTDDVEFGDPISAPEAPAKEGYTFNGWGEVPATMPAANLEYEGSYTVNTYAVTFSIGDQTIYSGTLPFGAEIVAPEAPALEGYSFGGWGVVPSTMPASDLNISGEYSLNAYTISYRIGEYDFFTSQVPYGAEVVAPAAPAMEGHSFSGWTGVPSVMPAADVVVSGSYVPNSYSLAFVIGDEVVFSGDMIYGAEILAPTAPAKEGHTFAGWGMVPATMPAADLTLNGSYDVNLYNLTYRIDDVDYFTTQISYGSPISAPEAPAKEGYSFLGWSDAAATMPASDLVVNGTYSVNSYKIAFRIGDVVVFEGELPYGTEILVPEAPAMEGHAFAGWGMVPATMPASDLEFVGAYDLNLYTITFDIDGEVFFQTQLAYGTEIVAPAEVPDKKGNSFGGWGSVPATMPANDLTVSGTYSLNHYTVTFRVGEEILFTGEQPFGSPMVIPEVPAKEGHSFSGWGDMPATVPAENVEFSGFYFVNSYRLTYVAGDETIYSAEVPFGSPLEAVAAPGKDGYSFTGWGVVPATMPASDLVLSGAYEVNYYSVVFKIGEEVIASAQVPYGSEITVPAAPEREGYAFAGWGDVPAAMPASDMTFEGQYSADAYTLTFAVDGEVILTQSVAYGAEVVAPEAPAKEGYSFLGWGVVPSTMPASDLQISGSYAVNVYNVVFRIGEEVILSAQVPFGGRISVPEAPAREGYSFKGWGEVPAAMPASDLVFDALYAAKEVKVTFMADGEVVFEKMLPFGAELVAPEAPVKEGYSFSGWGIVPAAVPLSDIVISGSYEVNVYMLTVRVDGETVFSAQLPYGAAIEISDSMLPEKVDFYEWEVAIPQTMPAHDLVLNGKTPGSSSVSTVAADGLIDVFDLNGVMILRGVSGAELSGRLTPGIYVVGGRKLVVR